MRFDLYIPKNKCDDFQTFITNTERPSKEILRMVCNYNRANISLDLPTIRTILIRHPENVKYLKELLDEF